MSSGLDAHSYLGIGVGVDELPSGSLAGDVSTYTGAEETRGQIPIPSGTDLVNVFYINSLSDLPAPDGSGFIEIGGGTSVYVFQSGTVDISPNKLKQTGGSVVLRGSSRYASLLQSDTTDPLITVVGGFYADEFMNMNNPNGPIYDYDGDVLPQAAFVSINCIVRGCTTIGNIANANTTSLRTFSVATTSVGGFTFTGSNLLQFNVSNMLGFSWAGTLLDLGTTTWDIINFGSNNRWISPGGTTIISGLASNGNFADATGRGIIEGNIFNGTGTALVGIDPQDTQWTFDGNVGVDNSRTDADAFLTATEAVTISVQGTYVPVAGTDWDSDISNHFTVTTAGVLTYIGIPDMDVEIMANPTIEKASGGSDLLAGKISIDTGSGFVVQDKTIGSTKNGDATQISCMGLFTLSTGDEVRLEVANLDGVTNINVINGGIVITAN